MQSLFMRRLSLALAVAGVTLPSIGRAAVECTGTCKSWDRSFFPSVDTYSSQATRISWLNRLQDESRNPIKFDFSPYGHLKGFAGDVQLTAPGSDAVIQWVYSKKRELGLPDGVTLRMIKEEAYYQLSSIEERRAGTGYTLRPSYREVDVVGRDLFVIVREKGDRIRGLYNGFVPALAGYRLANCGLAQKDAWSIAETYVGGTLSSIPEEPPTKTWFESGSITVGVPSALSQHWRLAGFDNAGMLRRIFVDCNSQVVSYATDAVFGFTPTTQHWGYANSGTYNPSTPDVLVKYLDSVTIPTGCTASASCTDPARLDSHGDKYPRYGLKDNLPAVMNYFYNASVPVSCPNGPINQSILVDRTNCFPWPFTGNGKGPVDNRNQLLQAVAANGYKDTNGQNGLRPNGICNVACYFGSSVKFVKDRVDADLVGHEYGHGISTQLGPSTQSNFNEMMSDFYGIVANTAIMTDRFQALGARPPGPYFYVDAPGAWDCGHPGDWYAICAWPHMDYYTDWTYQSFANGFNCAKYPRYRMGRLLFEVWQDIDALFGPVTYNYDDFRFFWRAWFVNVMRSVAVSQANFTSMLDFKAATTARLETMAGNPLNAIDIMAYWTSERLTNLFTSEDYGQRCFQ